MKKSRIFHTAPAPKCSPRWQQAPRDSSYVRHPDAESGSVSSLRLLRRSTGLADSLSRLRGRTAVTGARTHLQQTLRAPVRCAGIGVHSGRAVTMTIRPGRPNAGVVFVRVDVPPGARIIRAHWTQVESTQLSTVVGNGEGLSASTVEHLMAAFRGCGVDNAVVELDGPEVPIVDGSSAPLVQLIENVGLQVQPVARQYLRVLKPVEVRDGDKFARLTPDDLPRFAVAIDFPSPVIGRQSYSMVLREGTFQRELAECRTFGFQDELADLRRQGLALGGSLDNAVLVEGAQVVNPGGLRRSDEFVRHKMLDSIGDLYLAGAPIIGSYSAFKPGHAMNASLLSALFADADAWCMATSDEIWPEAVYPLDPLMCGPDARVLAR